MKRKSVFATIVLLFITTGSIFAKEAKSKTLVMYFSWGGTTEKMANMIASATGADLFKIESEKAYPESYTPCTKLVKEELDKGIVRKAKAVPDFSKYDTIFVGVPVWWHTAPTIMTAILEEHSSDLKEKTVVPFCTYASTYRDETLARLVKASPTANHLDGYGTNSPKQRDVDVWLKEIGIRQF